VQLPALQTALQTSPRSFVGGLRGLLPGIVLAALLAMLSLLLGDSLSAMAPEFGPLPLSPIVVAMLLGIAIRRGRLAERHP
jgi:uncharacterized membrane protein YadS